MALEFFSGFDGCGVDADLHTFLNNASDVADIDLDATNYFGSSGKSLRVNSASAWARFACTSAKTKVLGFHVLNAPQTSTISTTDGRCLCEFEGPAIKIHNHVANGIAVTIGASSTQIANASTSIPSAWTHIEVKVYSHVSAGTVDIKMNGVSVLAATGLNTVGSGITSVRLCAQQVTAIRYDNVFVATDWVGEVTSKVLYPSSDSAVAFSRSGGSANYEMVDETTGQDGDTTYVSSNNPTDEDFYGYQDVDTSYEVKGVTVVTIAKKMDTGAAQLTVKGVQSSTEYPLQTITLNTSYPATPNLNNFVVLDTAPSTAAWTPTILNAMTFGFENKEV